MDSEKEGQPVAALTIARDSGYADRARSYKVMLDGNELGKIGNGETKQFSVSAGRHELRLKIDWCGSKLVEFDIQEGEDLLFRANSSLRGFKILGTLWKVIFAPNSYILLEQASIGSPATSIQPKG